MSSPTVATRGTTNGSARGSSYADERYQAAYAERYGTRPPAVFGGDVPTELAPTTHPDRCRRCDGPLTTRDYTDRWRPTDHAGRGLDRLCYGKARRRGLLDQYAPIDATDWTPPAPAVITRLVNTGPYGDQATELWLRLIRDAALTVCSNSTSVAEARDLLALLGLTETVRTEAPRG